MKVVQNDHDVLVQPGEGQGEELRRGVPVGDVAEAAKGGRARPARHEGTKPMEQMGRKHRRITIRGIKTVPDGRAAIPDEETGHQRALPEARVGGDERNGRVQRVGKPVGQAGSVQRLRRSQRDLQFCGEDLQGHAPPPPGRSAASVQCSQRRFLYGNSV